MRPCGAGGPTRRRAPTFSSSSRLRRKRRWHHRPRVRRAVARQYGRRRAHAALTLLATGGTRLSLAIFPVAGLLAAAAALETVYRQILNTGSSLGSSAPVYSFAEMNRLMGFEEVWRFDEAHAEI